MKPSKALDLANAVVLILLSLFVLLSGCTQIKTGSGTVITTQEYRVRRDSAVLARDCARAAPGYDAGS